MTPIDSTKGALDALVFARQIANHAESLGASDLTNSCPVASSHLGAVLADCVLQAGLNYRTVVRARIERIVNLFPEAATLVGTTDLVNRGAVADFLMWKHSEKIERFIRLVRVLENHKIEDTRELQTWLREQDCRDELLKINGIGPKTVDYLSCLVGIDCVAVDRHIKAFAKEAGVEVRDYDGLKRIISYAADLLGMPRRDFDAWIWQRLAASGMHGLGTASPTREE
jgi:hypothetical protein